MDNPMQFHQPLHDDSTSADAHTPARQKQAQLLQVASARNFQRMQEEAAKKQAAIQSAARETAAAFQANMNPASLGQAWAHYWLDAAERTILTLDVLRKRGDIFLEHEAAGAPPVLIYDYETIVDGAKLPRPCNYMLLRIEPPSGIEVFDWKRPYVIIDPRAGHGPGIGGFKQDSQVGVALRDGHPVYFVAFRPYPQPGQTLACVTHAEATFLREIRKRHPKAPNPVVVGNCQGGWASAILAATNPDLAGPIVLNGAPMSYWSGRVGQDPMRYTGGIVGGVYPAMLMADLGGGLFDGAHLVQNFEMLNPARNWFRKYYDLYASVDKGEQRFLEFERWWGGLFLMNEAEIRWIVENLFVGNKLAKNEAHLETGRPVDLKAIRAPIIVFASHGDNITPPQQALNWIIDTYTNESEIEIRGQRIIYMVHDEVGHLGIFVSSSVAKREHTQMASTLKTIEALPPGLYEMKIEDIVGEGHDRRYTVSFHQRRFADLVTVDDGRDEEDAFAAVARMSELFAELYETTVRPLIRQTVSTDMAAFGRDYHPLRMQRAAFASHNPMVAPVANLAEQVRGQRNPVAADNPFLLAERLSAEFIETSLQMISEIRTWSYEMAFLTIYAGAWGQWYGAPHREKRAHKSVDELCALPEVVDAVMSIESGAMAEAVVRMLVMLAESRGNVRRDRLERSSEVLATRVPFSEMDPPSRARMIHMQSLIVHFEPDRALTTLPVLLPGDRERSEAIKLVEYIVGSSEEMAPRTKAALHNIRAILDLPPPKQLQTAAE
jgi:pimeloyl-ACP methyl ester carboxylesterase